MADSIRFLDQALIAQHDRLLKLTTSAGEDIFLPQRVVAQERMGRTFEYTIDVLAMRPLALHASSKAEGSSRRRVLHFVFAPRELPLGLSWNRAI